VVHSLSTVSALIYGLPHFTDIREYVQLVKGKSIARELIRRCNEITSCLLSEERSIEEICGMAKESLQPLLELSAGNTSGLKPLRIMRMSDVESKEIDWLWEPFLALGTFNLAEGEEGVGKSTLFCAIAAAVGAGRGLPGVAPEDHIPPSNVLFISAEDSL